MNGRERVLATIEGRRRDHLALMPITMMFAGDVAGIRYGEYARDHRKLAEAQARVAEEFGFDYVSTISDPAREAADFGAHVAWYDDQPPAILESDALLQDKATLARLKPLDPLAGGRMLDRVQGVALLKEKTAGEKFVEGWVEGPCAEGSDLRGINHLMTDFFDDPDWVVELFELIVANALGFARAQIAAGADIIGIGDAAASLVSPRVYQQFVWPYEKKLIDGIHAAGGRVRLHICGNTRKHLTGMGTLGCEIVDLDYPAPVAEAREQMGPRQVLLGNLNPVKVLKDGAPADVRAAIAACHAAAGANFIVGAGCEIARGTPRENLIALCDYARENGEN
jgi:MtaA/CmuA family methyltransferase